MSLLLLLLACQDKPLALASVDTGGPAVAATTTPQFLGDLEPWFQERCVACHRDASPEAGLDLTGDLRGDRLVVPSSQAEEFVLVRPGDYRYSYLWHKVNGSQSLAGGSGTSMPVGALATPEEIERLGWWIDLGLP